MQVDKEVSDQQAKIVKQFSREHKAKYFMGAIEHTDNGLLQEVPPAKLVEFAIEEVLDLVSYLYTLRDNLEVEDTDEEE